MLRLRVCFIVAAAVLVAAAAAVPAAAQQKLPDSTLYTEYSASGPHPTELNWMTCGSLPRSEGCYGGGTLGPFTNACAIVQSAPTAINAFTVIRYIYVLDTGSTSSGVTLTAYKRTDTVSQSDDTINVTQVSVVSAPSLTGGTGVSCMMAQNPTNVYAGTNQSSVAVSINKSSYAVSTVGGGYGFISSITADSYGFVVVNSGANGTYVNSVYAPNGDWEGGGGGDYFIINPINALSPANYPE